MDIEKKIQEAKEHQLSAALGELPLTNVLATCSMLIEVVEYQRGLLDKTIAAVVSTTTLVSSQNEIQIEQQKRIEQLERRLQALTNRQNCYDFEGV